MAKKPKKSGQTPASSSIRINYKSKQAVGLRCLVATAPFNGARNFPELVYYSNVTFYGYGVSEIWKNDPEIGGVLNYPSAVAGWTYVNHHEQLNFQRQMTVAGWFRASDVSVAPCGGVGKWHGSGNTNTEWFLRFDGPTTVPIFYVFVGATAYYAYDAIGGSGRPLTLGKLTHVCGTIDNSGKPKIYVDGVLAGVGSTVLSGDMNSGTGSVFIGADGSANYFVGDIGEVRLYNRGLSADEVKNLYDASSRWDLYESISYGSAPGDLPLPPQPPPASLLTIVLDALTLAGSVASLAVEQSIDIALDALTLASSVGSFVLTNIKRASAKAGWPFWRF